jgi:hypothetical protein
MRRIFAGEVIHSEGLPADDADGRRKGIMKWTWLVLVMAAAFGAGADDGLTNAPVSAEWIRAEAAKTRRGGFESTQAWTNRLAVSRLSGREFDIRIAPAAIEVNPHPDANEYFIGPSVMVQNVVKLCDRCAGLALINWPAVRPHFSYEDKLAVKITRPSPELLEAMKGRSAGLILHGRFEALEQLDKQYEEEIGDLCVPFRLMGLKVVSGNRVLWSGDVK